MAKKPSTKSPVQDLDEALASVVVRAEQIIWLPAAIIDHDALPEMFAEEFCGWLPEDPDSELYSQLPELRHFLSGDDEPSPEDVAAAIGGRPGFLVQAATPVRTPLGEKGCSYSWGHYHIAWLYAATEADIGPVMIAWAKKCEAADRAERAA